MEEKRSLEEKVAKSSGPTREEYQFELDVALSNIQHVQEKLAGA